MASDDSRPRAIDGVQRQRDRLRDAHTGFERVCQAPGVTPAAVLDMLATLRSAFVEHVAYTEGPGGLFEEMSIDAPLESASEVDRLRRDHITIDGVIDRVEQGVGSGTTLDDEHTQEGIAELVRIIAQHRRRGIELTYNVYGVDIGAGD